MKKVTLYCVALIFAMLTTLELNAQIRVDIMAGGAKPLGQDFQQAAKWGVGYSVDVTYIPDFLDKQLSFGIARDGNIVLMAEANYDDKKVDLKASTIGIFGGKVRFDMKTGNKVSPYAALTIGNGRLKCAYAKLDGEDDEDGRSASSAYMRSNAFIVKPEIGVSLGAFQMSLGWILPRTYYGTTHIKAGVFMYNLGFRILAE